MQKNTVGNYYPLFDWLRAIAAIVVMLYHDRVIPWGDAGNFAVQVFFALSGWLIGGILLRSTIRDLPRFYFNRVIRIWAPYYLAVLILLTLSVLREPVTQKWMEFVIYKLLFVYNIFGTPQLADFQSAMPERGTLSHVWSVNAEEQFYLFAPLLLVVAAVRKGRSIGLWMVLAGVAWYFNIYASIFFGVLLAIASKQYSVEKNFKFKVAAGLLLILSSFGLYFFSEYYFKIAPFAAVSIVLLLARLGRASKIGLIAGGMSYPLYLNHWMGVYIFNYLLPGQHGVLRVTLAAVANILIAVGLYWFYDKRLLASRGRWFTAQRGLFVMLVAYSMIVVGVVYGISKTSV